MAAKFLQAFDLASSDVREQIMIGIVERLSDDEVQCCQTALQRLERRFDILCGISKASGGQMPHEIQIQIVDLLNITDIYYCINVCRKWRCLLLECKQLSDDLLKKWFPKLLDEERMKSDQLHQAIRRRHLRDTGRFRSRQVNFLSPQCAQSANSSVLVRFTCGFLKNADGVFPVDRVESLQHGHRFKNLTCSLLRIPPQIPTLTQTGALHQAGSSSNSTPSSSYSRAIPGQAVSKYLYADGRFAWQLTPAPGEWVNSILVHDFHAHRRWNLTVPSMRTRGIKLVLWALGRDLVVARVVGERVLYAWDLVSHAVDRVTLQNPPNRCFTRYRSVVIVTHSGDLLLWSFGHGLANVDMAMPQDERDYRGPAKPRQIPRAPLSAFEIQNSRVMFHPRDEDVFFLATFDDRNQSDETLLLWVYEFKNKRCCRIFTCSIPPKRRLWIVFGAQKVNAHGTYQLLELETPTHNVVTFNTINKSFGALKFQTPSYTDIDAALVWNDHLVLTYVEDASDYRQSLVALGQLPYPVSLKEASDTESELKTLERVIDDMVACISSLEVIDNDVVSSQRFQTAVEASEQGKPKDDIIRAPDVSTSVSDLGGAICPRYVLSLFGGRCDKKGCHVRECPPTLGLSERDLSSLSFRVVSILGDDDFLIVVTNRNYYIVFAVDEDGKLAEAMLDATDSVEEAAPNDSVDSRDMSQN